MVADKLLQALRVNGALFFATDLLIIISGRFFTQRGKEAKRQRHRFAFLASLREIIGESAAIFVCL